MRDIKPRILSRIFLSGLLMGSFSGLASTSQAQIFQAQEAKPVKKTLPSTKAITGNPGKSSYADGPIIPRDIEIRLGGSFGPINLFRFLPLEVQKTDEQCKEKCCPQEVVHEQDPFLPEVVPECIRRDMVQPAKAGPFHLDIQLTRGTESELHKLKAEIAQLQAEMAKIKAAHLKVGNTEVPQRKAVLITEGQPIKNMGVGRIEGSTDGIGPTHIYGIRIEDSQNPPTKVVSNQNNITALQVIPISSNPNRLSPKALENLLEVLRDVPPATRTKLLEMVFGGQAAPTPIYPSYAVPVSPQPVPYSHALPYPQVIPSQQPIIHAPGSLPPPSPDLTIPANPQPFASVRGPHPVQVASPWTPQQTQGVSVNPPTPNLNSLSGRNPDKRGPNPPPLVPLLPTPSAEMIPPVTPAPSVPLQVPEQRVPSSSSANEQKLNLILEKLERLENRLDSQERRSQLSLPPRGEPSYKPVPPPLAQPTPAVTPN